MIRSEHAHLLVNAQSHPGMTGKNNEDRYAVSAYRLSRNNITPALFAVICDGIGGHRAGEVAAEIAVDTISRHIAESNPAQPIQALQEAIIKASQAIYDKANGDDGRQGMGSTCACTWIIGNCLYTTSIGDSRIYLLRNGSLHQLTTDHTWIQEALDAGLIGQQQIHGHPNAHVIRRYLGSPNPPQCDFRMKLRPAETDEQALANQGSELLPGDRLLICSDGLTDMVSSPEIEKVLQEHTLSTIPQVLIDLANQRGGHDNITLVLLEVPAQSGKNLIKALIRWISAHWQLSALILGVLVIVILGALALWLGGVLLFGGNTISPFYQGGTHFTPSPITSVVAPAIKPSLSTASAVSPITPNTPVSTPKPQVPTRLPMPPSPSTPLNTSSISREQTDLSAISTMKAVRSKNGMVIIPEITDITGTRWRKICPALMPG